MIERLIAGNRMFGKRLGRGMWRRDKGLAGGILEAKRRVKGLIVLLFHNRVSERFSGRCCGRTYESGEGVLKIVRTGRGLMVLGRGQPGGEAVEGERLGLRTGVVRVIHLILSTV